jgi:gas vesicle protein
MPYNTAHMRGDHIITGQRRKVKNRRAKLKEPAKNMPAADNTPVAKGQVQDRIAPNITNQSPETQTSLPQNSTAQPQVSRIQNERENSNAQPSTSNTQNEATESVIPPSTKAQRRRDRRKRIRTKAQNP